MNQIPGTGLGDLMAANGIGQQNQNDTTMIPLPPLTPPSQMKANENNSNSSSSNSGCAGENPCDKSFDQTPALTGSTNANSCAVSSAENHSAEGEGNDFEEDEFICREVNEDE